MVDVKDMCESDYLIPDEVHELGINERKGVITIVSDEKIKGRYGKELEIVVEIKGKAKRHNLMEGGKSIKALSKAYGYESKAWVGQIVNLSVEITRNKKEYVLLTPSDGNPE